MKLLKQKDGTYKAESHTKGKYYIVNPEKRSCTCLHYRFRMAKIGGLCKHLEAVMKKSGAGIKKVSKKAEKKQSKLIDFVKKNKKVDSLKLIKKFGEDAVNEMINKRELIEEKGIIRILE